MAERLLRVLRKNPFTLAVLLVVIAMAVLGRGLAGPTRHLAFTLGTGYQQVVDGHRWWTPVTSVFLTNGGIELPIVILAVVLVIGPAERLLGTARAAIAFFVTAIAGVVLGIIIQELGYLVGELWSRRVSELVTLDPMTAVVGTVMTASAFAPALWRRRIRVVVSVVVIVFLLYAGNPSDLYRALAAVAGLALGVVMRGEPASLRWQRSTHHETRVLLSSVVAITAIGPAIAVFSTLRLGALAPLGLLLGDARPNGISSVDECHASDITRMCLHDMTVERISGVGPVLVTVLPILTLMVAAFGLAGGRRFAAWLAVVVNVALAGLAAWFYGFLPFVAQSDGARANSPRYWEVSLALGISVLLPLSIAVLVLANLSHLTVRAPRRSVKRYLVSTVAALVILSTLYVAVGSLMRDRFHPVVTVVDLLANLPSRFIPVGFLRIERLVFLPTAPLTRFLYYWIGPLFWLTVIAGALYVVLSASGRVQGSDSSRVRALLREGGGTLSFWSTWPGNSYWFTPDGRNVVAYRVVNGIALTSSDPIGQEAEAAITGFATFCDDNGWVPVFYSVHDHVVSQTTAMGWSATGVGDETVVLPGEWKTEGKRWQDIRTSINRADRLGVTSTWTSFASLSTAHALQLAELSEQWVAEKELPELGFTLGGDDELRDPDVRLMVATDADDRVVGVTSWLPSWRNGVVIGWTLDFMRRTPDGPNGIMEYLIARCAELFQAQGIGVMSLSAAPLANEVDAEVDAEPDAATRLLGYLGSRLEPVYGFRSLLAFKRKFQPEFRPLWMAYPDPLQLPTIGIALARAYLPSMSMRQAIRFVRGLG